MTNLKGCQNRCSMGIGDGITYRDTSPKVEVSTISSRKYGAMGNTMRFVFSIWKFQRGGKSKDKNGFQRTSNAFQSDGGCSVCAWSLFHIMTT